MASISAGNDDFIGTMIADAIEKVGPDVQCKCIDPGLLLPRANLTFWREGRLVRERNAMLPTISSKVRQMEACLL